MDLFWQKLGSEIVLRVGFWRNPCAFSSLADERKLRKNLESPKDLLSFIVMLFWAAAIESPKFESEANSLKIPFHFRGWKIRAANVLRSTLYQSLCQGEILARDANLRPAPSVSSRWTAVMKSYLLSCFFVFYRIESWIEWKVNFQEIWWPQTIRDPAISCSQMTFTRRLKFGRQKTCRLEFEVPAFFPMSFQLILGHPTCRQMARCCLRVWKSFAEGPMKETWCPERKCLVKSRPHSCSRGFGRALWHADICCGLYVGAKSLEPGLTIQIPERPASQQR